MVRIFTRPLMVQVLPPQIVALMVKRTSWLPQKEEVKVRFLVGVLKTYPRSVPAARDRAKVENEVRFLTGILWPNPKGQRDTAVNRGLWVRLPPATLQCRRCSTGRAPLA